MARRHEDADDLPSTHLDDDEYEEFLAREFDAEGELRSEVPVAQIIWLIVAGLALMAVWLVL